MSRTFCRPLAQLTAESTDVLEQIYDNLLELIDPRNAESYKISSADYRDINTTLRRIDLIIRSRSPQSHTSAGAPNG